LPFDHIFFTGSPKIGKVIMAAAARHLSSVTLELGGKSPVIITEDADIQKSAEKIVWGKFINSGQTCIAPDYVLIHSSKENEFLSLAKLKIEQLFYNETVLDKGSYGKIINAGHYQRLQSLRDKAMEDGALVVKGGTDSVEDHTLAPVLLSNVSDSSAIMQEEIFGPLLPVIGYESIEKAIEFINQRPKPLALYVFSGSGDTIRDTIRQTSAGGTCVNDVVIHISNPNLPFGGIGNSGSGSCHGFFGFKAFSHERAVMFQSKMDFSKVAYPPYSKKRSLLKWLKKIM
jgi:aldehyde dehydrogenase (NAD+)